MPVVGIRDMSVRSIQTSWPLSLSWRGFKWFHHCLPSFNIFLHSSPSNEKSSVAMKNGKKQKLKQIKHQMYQQMRVATGESYLWVIWIVFNSRMTILKSLTMKWWYQNHKILFRWFPPETEVDQTRFNSLLQKSFIAVLIHLQLLLGYYFLRNSWFESICLNISKIRCRSKFGRNRRAVLWPFFRNLSLHDFKKLQLARDRSSRQQQNSPDRFISQTVVLGLTKMHEMAWTNRRTRLVPS